MPLRQAQHGEAAAPVRLRHHRDFLLVAVGQGVSAIGDAFSLTVLPLLVLAMAGSGKHLGLVMLSYTIPGIAFSPLAGALADRWNRKRIMVWTELGRAALTGLVPLAAAGAWLRVELIYVVSGCLGLLTPLFTAAYTAAVPRLVPPAQLPAALGSLQAVTRIGLLIGPSLAGVLATWSSAVTALAIDAATFVVSSVTLSALRRGPDQTAGSRERVAVEIRRGLEFLAGATSLRGFMIVNVLLTLVTAPGLIALVHHLQVERGQPPWVFGLVLSANGVGAIAGYLAAGRVRRAWRSYFVGGNTLRALANLAFPLLASSTLYMTAGFVAGFSSAFVSCVTSVIYVHAVPDQFRGRIAGLVGALDAAVYALGVTAGGLAIDLAGSGTTIACIGGLQLCVGALCLRSPQVRWTSGPTP